MLAKRLNKFPPYLCRLVARTGKGKGCRALTLTEIAAASGLDVSTVARLSYRRKWDDEPLWVISQYAIGCGVNLLHPRRHLDYLKRRKKISIRKRDKYFKRLLQEKPPLLHQD
jgi:hypothetical protein